MQMSKWWKCDLQVATPAWDFKLPAGDNFDFLKPADREKFADLYMEALKEKGVEVIALADHNTHEWIDDIKAAGERHGIVVFPGCEVTTSTGADGAHLLIVGDRHLTGRDFDVLLGKLGFDDEHPRFHTVDSRQQPGSSSKTLCQILDDLPDDYLVIAPHVLTDNGIASKKTAKGDIRWKALHHERLNAVDPGDCSSPSNDSWNNDFRTRTLDNFPCLQHLAFVSTSDAYRLEDLGCRFSWIRMAEPTFEALRQAFLDHEARIICHWDARLAGYPDRNPNRVRHAWIESVKLGPGLGNSEQPIEIPLLPGLNTIIGGRGSGKSTVVACLRQLYAGTDTLPPNVKTEAESFVENILTTAELSSAHRLSNSQELQNVRWSKSTGSQTLHSDGSSVPTSFKVRVVNQKELFERVAKDKHDPFAASRSFLAFVDEGLGYNKTDAWNAASWWRRFNFASTRWTDAIRAQQILGSDLRQLPSVNAGLDDLAGQLAAFDSEEARSRQQRFKEKRQQEDAIEEATNSFQSWIEKLPTDSPILQPQEPAADGIVPSPDNDSYIELRAKLTAISKEYQRRVADLKANAQGALDEFLNECSQSEWWKSTEEATADNERYIGELRQKGIDPKSYTALQNQLKSFQALKKQLVLKESERARVDQELEESWNAVLELIDERIGDRRRLLDEVSSRSGKLKFSIKKHEDVNGWVQAVRELLNLRSDAFLEDVPLLGEWLWTADETLQVERWTAWRTALASGDFSALVSANLRQNWLKRLQTLDEAIRLRLAVLIADDVVTMKFLKDRADPSKDENWQDITKSSPGQRTAAMLGFVLHHGLEPLVLDQPEDDLDTEWISNLIVEELRRSRWKRQIIVVTHNANIPVNGDADQVVVLENADRTIRIRSSVDSNAAVIHCGPIELRQVRTDIQNIMEGGIRAFVRREKKYNNEMRILRILPK